MASTYSSNLNIEIITSGEQAGTWGDTTNQNWKRIEESRTYATQDLGGSASVDWTLGDTTDAYVTADIGSNPSSGRAAFVKFTNAHGSGTTIDINGNSNTDFPNRVFFAYNNSGATLTFSGGSGANFALQNGASAAIYSNGTLADNVLSTLQVGGNAGGTAGLILAGGSITDVTDAISFSDNSLTTTGAVDFGAATVDSLNVSEGNITNVGDIALDTISADGSTITFSSNWTAAGRTCANLGTVTTADIDGGSIDGTDIGAGTPGTGAFTTLTASGNVDLGNATSDTITVAGRFDSDLIPSSDNARDLGASSAEWKDLYLDGTANIDSLVADTAAINGGSIDNVTIGTNTAVTELQVDYININDNVISSTDSNGSIVIQPNGTGDINLRTDEVRLGDSGENSTLTTFGTGDLTLNTNEGTNSGFIKIFDGVNGTIDIVPNGTGNIQLFQGGGNGLLTLDGNSIDNVNYLHCQSISSESNTTDFVLHFNSNTGKNIIKLDDGKADALSIVDNSGNDYMVFDTHNDIITFSQNPTFAGRTIANLGTVSAATSITSSAFVGPLTGNVTGNASGSSSSCTGNSATATTATNVTVTDNESTAEENLIAFVADAATSTGNHGLEMDGDFTYNPSTGTVTATTFNGRADRASKAIIANGTTNANHYVTFVNSNGVPSSYALEQDAGLLFNPSTNTLSATNITGTLTSGAQNNITSASSVATVGTVTAGTWESTINSNLQDTNVGIGDSAGAAATGSTENCVFIGHQAGDQVTGNRNTIIGGENAGPAITNGSNNVIVGSRAGRALDASASQVVCIGEAALYGSGEGNLDIDNSVYVGYLASGTDGADYEIAIGRQAVGKGSNTCSIGSNSNYIWYDLTGSNSWTYVASDERLKKNITELDLGLNFINDLNPVNFNFKQSEDIDDSTPENIQKILVDEEGFSTKTEKLQYGFIAQEVKETIEDHNAVNLGLWSSDPDGIQSVGSGALVVPLVKAIQELSSKIDSLESRLAALE